MTLFRTALYKGIGALHSIGATAHRAYSGFSKEARRLHIGSQFSEMACYGLAFTLTAHASMLSYSNFTRPSLDSLPPQAIELRYVQDEIASTKSALQVIPRQGDPGWDAYGAQFQQSAQAQSSDLTRVILALEHREYVLANNPAVLSVRQAEQDANGVFGDPGFGAYLESGACAAAAVVSVIAARSIARRRRLQSTIHQDRREDAREDLAVRVGSWPLTQSTFDESMDSLLKSANVSRPGPSKPTPPSTLSDEELDS